MGYTGKLKGLRMKAHPRTRKIISGWMHERYYTPPEEDIALGAYFKEESTGRPLPVELKGLGEQMKVLDDPRILPGASTEDVLHKWRLMVKYPELYRPVFEDPRDAPPLELGADYD